MKQPHDQDTRGEEGVALFYSLLVTLVVAGIVAVIFAGALTQQRQSAFELDFEDSIHVAEAGAEVLLGRLADDADLTSGVAGPTATGETPADWAIRVVTEQSSPGVYTFTEAPIDLGEGETFAVRPTGGDAEFVYGVGFVPSRDAWVQGIGDPYVRVVRVQVAFSPTTFSPNVALLAGGNLTLSGNYKVTGSVGGVHTNGALAKNGSGTNTGDYTYSGSCSQGCDATVTGPVAPVPIPEVDRLKVWSADPAIVIAAAGDWYDYCAGTWRQRNSTDTAPCQGPAVGVGNSDIQPWSGTNYNNPSTPSSAVYYFNGGENVDIKKPSGQITVITGGTIDVGPSAGDPPVDARYPGLFLLADGEIDISGNSVSFATQQPALVFSNTTITLGGTLSTNEISFIARDSTNVGTSYKGGGNGEISYSGGAIVDFNDPGDPIVVQWDEVR